MRSSSIAIAASAAKLIGPTFGLRHATMIAPHAARAMSRLTGVKTRRPLTAARPRDDSCQHKTRGAVLSARLGG